MGENFFDTNWLMELYKLNQKNIKGFTSILNIIEYPKSIDFFTNLELIVPSNRDYQQAIDLAKNLYKMGNPIPAVDILIASICYNSKFILISRDKHFDAVKEVWNDFQISQDYNIKNKKEK